MSYINILKNNRKLANIEEERNFSEALDAVGQARDMTLLGELHRIFDDDAANHEIVFQLIHYLESFPAEQQIAAMRDALPDMAKQAFYWTKVLHFRILNDPPSIKIYESVFSKAKGPAYDTACNILMTILKEESGHLKKQAELLLKNIKCD